ncbi:DNA polymerase III subunit delta [Desulfovibrio sp.]|uniref:DNA polymerase III subunit delta n=1 Tax=Desulfovibrio sp. TaxID=885 RepID=UPI0025C3F1F2|nr:DNA polymerase III subunit delta [Desulfovibrio sp.]
MSTTRPGFSFLVCPDGQLLREHLVRQLSAYPPAVGGGLLPQNAPTQWERHVYWGDEEPPQKFWEHLTLQGLFGAPRALVVRQANLWPAAVWKKISHALARPSDQCWPFFCLEVNWERGQPKVPAHLGKLPCMAFADKKGWIWRQEGLGERTVRKHVLQRCQALGLRFAPDALEQFCASVPPDALAIENELEKLMLLRRAMTDSAQEQEAGTPVTLAMISTASWSPECDVFACIRHMQAGNLAAVWKELARNKDGDSLLFSLLALLARELRLLWQCQAGENPRMRPQDASAKKQLARRLGPAAIAQGMSLIVDAELQVKSGRRSPDQSLDFLAARMTALFARAQGRA